METKQISETIKTGQQEVDGRIRFFAWLKMPHMKKSRFFVSVDSEADVIKQAQQFEEKESAYKTNRKEEKAKQRQERAQKDKLAALVCKVGQIYEDSWGYDQTNVDFYQVIEVKGQMATLRPIAGDLKETGFMCGVTTPRPNDFKGELMKKRIQGYDGKPCFSSRYAGAITLWDGKPCRCSWYA